MVNVSFVDLQYILLSSKEFIKVAQWRCVSSKPFSMLDSKALKDAPVVSLYKSHRRIRILATVEHHTQ